MREGLDFSNWICYLHISWTNPQSCWGFFVIFMDQNCHVMENKPHPSSFTSCIALGTSNHKKPLSFYYQRSDTVTLGRGSKIIPLVGTQVSLHSLSVCHCVMVFLCDGRKVKSHCHCSDLNAYLLCTMDVYFTAVNKPAYKLYLYITPNYWRADNFLREKKMLDLL